MAEDSVADVRRVDMLFEAAWNNRCDELKTLLEKDVAVNSTGMHSLPALWAAMENDSYDAVDCLLKHGADEQSFGTPDWHTPLGMAVEDVVIQVTDNVNLHPSLRIVSALLDRGANPATISPPFKKSYVEFAQALDKDNLPIGRELLALFAARGYHAAKS